MVNIRRGIFETNSSSSHSIVVRKPKSTLGLEMNLDPHGHYECGYLRDDGELHVHCNEFGWGFSILSKWVDKFIYALVEFNDDRDEMNRIIDVMKQRHPDFRSIDIDVDTNAPFTRDTWGYIDHQSQGILRTALKQEGIAVEDLIDDDRYIIVIDNDNSCYLDMVSGCGLLDKDSIAKQYI